LAAAAATAVVVCIVMPAKYVAQAQLELASRSKPLFTDPANPEPDPAIFRASQQALIKSPLVLSSALASDKLKGLKIASESPKALESALKADFTQSPEIMTIKLYGDEPDHLAEVLSAIIQAYKKEIETRDNQRKTMMVQQLEKSVQDYKKTLNDKRIELRKVERDADIPDANAMQIMFHGAIVKVGGVEAGLRSVRNDLGKKKLDLKAMQARLAAIETEPVSPAKLRAALNSLPVLTSYYTKMAALDELIADLAAFPKTPNRDSQIESLVDKKRGLVGSAKAAENALRPQIEKQLRAETKELLESDIRTALGNIKALELDEESLQQELQRVQIELQANSLANKKGSVLVENLRGDVKHTEETLARLAHDVALLKAEPTATSRIVVLQAPETPTERDYSRLLKFAASGSFGAFGLVLFGVAFLEFRSRRVSAVDEVTQGLGLQLIGTMPKLPTRTRQTAGGSASPKEIYWQSVIAESIDAIRTQLLHADQTDAVRVVMITSAGGGEGKTSLASQLAASLARAWRKTLLVDADLRHPAAHKLFDLPLEPGLCEVLRGEANLGDVVKPTLLSRLWLMTAGHWDAHAVQALAQPGVSNWFDQMKQQYDFVIVDSCPVLPVADALLLSQHVDGVIFSVLRDVTRLPAVHAAQQKLDNLGVRTLGVVVIGADSDPASLVDRYAARAGG
jgi:capsular exopolysaccharide synthesis family protein